MKSQVVASARRLILNLKHCHWGSKLIGFTSIVPTLTEAIIIAMVYVDATDIDQVHVCGPWYPTGVVGTTRFPEVTLVSV